MHEENVCIKDLNTVTNNKPDPYRLLPFNGIKNLFFPNFTPFSCIFQFKSLEKAPLKSSTSLKARYLECTLEVYLTPDENPAKDILNTASLLSWSHSFRVHIGMIIYLVACHVFKLKTLKTSHSQWNLFCRERVLDKWLMTHTTLQSFIISMTSCVSRNIPVNLRGEGAQGEEGMTYRTCVPYG